MELQLLIFFCFFVAFGIPLILFIVGWTNHQRKEFAKAMYIIGAVWLLIGGGICATILMQ